MKENKVEIIIYEPSISLDIFNDTIVENNLGHFKNKSDIIITNRLDDDLLDVLDKVYTRDIFNNN